VDRKFIKNALQSTNFNLKTTDFETLRYKEEIQHLFTTKYFNKVEPKFIKTTNLTKIALNQAISKLRNQDAAAFKALHMYPLKNIGPGEVTLFYLIQLASLSGGKTDGDLEVGSKKFEVKAVNVSPDGYASNFKLGGKIVMSDIIRSVQDLKKAAGLTANPAEVNKTELGIIKKKFPNELEQAFKDFQDLAYDKYFKSHNIIFMANQNGGGYQMGDVARIARIEKRDIEFERITSGTIKPRVYLGK
jgi:hypothetical protein